MTISTSIQILDRVSSAKPQSRIAVYKMGNELDCVFVDTVYGLQRVKRGVGLVAVFDGTETNNQAWHILRKAMNNNDSLVSLTE